MRRVARVACGMAIAAVTLAVSMQRAHACSCGPLPPANGARDAAAAVFEGFVLCSVVDPQSHSLRVQFQVMRSWKGVDVDTVVYVQTADSDASCGVNAPPGELMLVYAGSGTAGLKMALCSRTAPSALIPDDFVALGPPAQTGLLAAGALTCTGSPAATGGAAGTGGPVHADGCAVANGRPSAAIGFALALALVLRQRQQRHRPDRPTD